MFGFQYSNSNIFIRTNDVVSCVLFSEVMKARLLQIEVLNPCDIPKARLINFMGV